AIQVTRYPPYEPPAAAMRWASTRPRSIRRSVAHDIEVRLVAPASLDPLREILPPRRRALEVDQRGDIARRREQLRVPPEAERVAADPVRAAVDDLHEWIARALFMVRGQHDEHLDGRAVRAIEDDLAHCPGAIPAREVVGEMRHALGRAGIRAQYVDLRRMAE